VLLLLLLQCAAPAAAAAQPGPAAANTTSPQSSSCTQQPEQLQLKDYKLSLLLVQAVRGMLGRPACCQHHQPTKQLVQSSQQRTQQTTQQSNLSCIASWCASASNTFVCMLQFSTALPAAFAGAQPALHVDI
jgi:hypothetical protein